VQKFLKLCSLSHLFNYIVILTTNSGEQLKFDMPLGKLSEHEVTLIEQEEYMNRNQPDPFNIEPDALKLEECLQKFVSLEQLDDLWLCKQSKCTQNTYANKQLQFNSLPRVLIIQLKRFSYADGYRRKLDTFVDYPINGLNLSYLLSSSSSEKASIYDLIAVSNHIGSIYSGHYTAYARQDPSIDKWYKFDDSFISTINFQDEIVSRNAYLLVYIKRNK
jgi:ubiquitin carboxyl-terminal hydrolase 4/11/15